MEGEKEVIYYDDDVEHLCKAMLKAQEAFNEYFEEQSIDGAYFSLYLTGYVLSDEFQKLKEIEMNINTTGLEKFKYPDKRGKNVGVR